MAVAAEFLVLRTQTYTLCKISCNGLILLERYDLELQLPKKCTIQRCRQCLRRTEGSI